MADSPTTAPGAATPEPEPSAPANAVSSETPKPVTFAEFLESTPPNVEMSISDLAVRKSSQYGGTFLEMLEPDIQLHCDSDVCNGVRVFQCTTGGGTINTNVKCVFIYYRCRNCENTTKIYSVMARVNGKLSAQGVARKFGEAPTFGPHVPSESSH